MEDPLFDPWSHEIADPAPTDEPDGSEERQPTSDEAAARRSGVRWRSTGGGVPATRGPLPSKFSELTAEPPTVPVDLEQQAAESPASVEETEPTGREDEGTDVGKTPPQRALSEGGPAEGTPEHTLLRRVEWLVRRLRADGHGAMVESRLDEPRRSVRVHFTPHPSPFSADRGGRGPVLDVRLDPETDELLARSWLDPLAQHPTSEERVTIDKVDDAFVHGLLLEFVKRTLRSA